MPSDINFHHQPDSKCGASKKMADKVTVHSSIDRNLAQAMAELDRLSDKVSIPNFVKEKAAVIYRKALVDRTVIVDRNHVQPGFV